MLLGELIEYACLCGRGSDAVYGNIVKGGLLPERFGEGDDASLGRAVCGGGRVSFLACDRGNVDDPTVVLANHVRYDRATAKEDSSEIDFDYLLPSVDGILPCFEVRAGNTRAGY